MQIGCSAKYVKAGRYCGPVKVISNRSQEVAEVIRGLLRSNEFSWSDVRLTKVTKLLVRSHEDGYGHMTSAEVTRCRLKSTKVL